MDEGCCLRGASGGSQPSARWCSANGRVRHNVHRPVEPTKEEADLPMAHQNAKDQVAMRPAAMPALLMVFTTLALPAWGARTDRAGLEQIRIPNGAEAPLVARVWYPTGAPVPDSTGLIRPDGRPRRAGARLRFCCSWSFLTVVSAHMNRTMTPHLHWRMPDLWARPQSLRGRLRGDESRTLELCTGKLNFAGCSDIC